MILSTFSTSIGHSLLTSFGNWNLLKVMMLLSAKRSASISPQLDTTTMLLWKDLTRSTPGEWERITCSATETIATNSPHIYLIQGCLKGILLSRSRVELCTLVFLLRRVPPLLCQCLMTVNLSSKNQFNHLLPSL